MEACNAVERELDKVLLKFSTVKQQVISTLDDLLAKAIAVKSELDSNVNGLTSERIEAIKSLLKTIHGSLQKITTEHRELHGNVSKVGKAIDRNFVADFASTSRPGIFSTSDKIDLLNQVICQHFYRLGMRDIADELAKESSVNVGDFNHEPFLELNSILSALKEKNLDPALEWAESHREKLEKQNSSLEFKLHRLRFISIIEKGPGFQADAIFYARNHFKQFVRKHEKDIQNLMGMFLYLPNGLNNSPYNYLLKQDLWLEICDVFMHDACLLLNLSVDSPLSICVNAGCIALPALLNIKQVMQQRQVASIWNGKDELPIEIDLGPNNHYHSVFACPILRQQSTTTNPPMKLICGHAISRDALNRLCQGNKLKCPYCPIEQSPSEARLIYF